MNTAGSKQEKCDEISNEVKIMLIKTCRTKDFIEKNTTSRSSLERRSARRTALLVEQGCTYSHIPMTVNQELLVDTKHVQEQKGATTLNMFWTTNRHQRDHTPTTTKTVGALPRCHPGRQGTLVGPGKDTHGTPVPEREGRGWLTTRSTVRQTCTTKRQTPLFSATYMVAEPCSVQSAQPGQFVGSHM